MNILFIDSISNYRSFYEKISYKYFGYYLRKYNEYYFLSVNKKSTKYKFLNLLLNLIFKNSELLVVKSKKADYYTDLNHIKCKIIEITEQNNLLINDRDYIDDFLNSINLKKEEAKVLLIIDELVKNEKEKVLECIKDYKRVDIFVTRKAQYFYTLDYVKKVDDEYGTTTQTLDKMPKLDYNILLVFSKKDIKISSNSSFILDYNNSDLDINSNTYKVYLKNSKEINNVFNSLGMIKENYWKTKLGKLYIYKKWNTLDK